MAGFVMISVAGSTCSCPKAVKAVVIKRTAAAVALTIFPGSIPWPYAIPGEQTFRSSQEGCLTAKSSADLLRKGFEEALAQFRSGLDLSTRNHELAVFSGHQIAWPPGAGMLEIELSPRRILAAIWLAY